MSHEPHAAGPRLNLARFRVLSERRDGPALARLASHFGLVVALGALALVAYERVGTLWALPAIAVEGLLMAFLFMPLHETVHRTAFRTEWLNTVTGHLCGVAICFPWEYYRHFHWAHHRHTQDEKLDPELVTMPSRSSLPRLVLAFSGALQIYGRMRILFRHAVTGASDVPWVPKEKKALVVREARFYLAIYASLAIASVLLVTPSLLLAWLVPLLIGQFVLRPYLYTEHTGCGHSRNAFENTRTTYTNGVIRWFAWNMPYHSEHHAYPSVPFHALPQVNALVGSGLMHVERGYTHALVKGWRALQ